jgi:hypothetical protein
MTQRFATRCARCSRRGDPDDVGRGRHLRAGRRGDLTFILATIGDHREPESRACLPGARGTSVHCEVDHVGELVQYRLGDPKAGVLKFDVCLCDCGSDLLLSVGFGQLTLSASAESSGSTSTPITLSLTGVPWFRISGCLGGATVGKRSAKNSSAEASEAAGSRR